MKDMDSLYLLSLLLTGDHSMAKKGFVSGLEDARKGNAVFKEWAHSWARRTIIQNAIRMVRPRATDSSSSARRAGHAVTQPAEIAAVAELPAFERFAFVMSVLESFSDQECSLLLGCTRGEVTAARNRALQQIGRSAELQHKLVSIASDKKTLRDVPESELQLEAFSQLAASA